MQSAEIYYLLLLLLIGIEQNGFVPARFIAENNMLLHEIIEYTKKHYTKKGGLLLFLDFEKAFDRVDHDFMLQVLDRMAFPSEFINWIQLLYTSATSSVRINNMNSKALNLLLYYRLGESRQWKFKFEWRNGCKGDSMLP